MKREKRDFIVMLNRLQISNLDDIAEIATFKYGKIINGSVAKISKEIGYSEGFTRTLCYLYFYLSANGIRIFDKPTPLVVAIKEILKNQIIREKVMTEIERFFPSIIKEVPKVEMLETHLIRNLKGKNPKCCYLSVKDFLKLHPEIRKEIPYQEKEVLTDGYAVIIVEVPKKYESILREKGLV